MHAHRWLIERRGDRIQRWTHVCVQCGCRKGRGWNPVCGRVNIYRMPGESITHKRPGCTTAVRAPSPDGQDQGV